MTCTNAPPDSLTLLTQELRQALEERHGPLLSGQALASSLGHGSVAGLRQARHRGHVAVALFTVPKRRGYFALTRDVADWLARARLAMQDVEEGESTQPDS